ncbi:MAG TPA: HAD family hydrolase, partial [Dehalococcoidia bacterium]|nr:HAD family hydrolase [Dehalococcoidia bacterium]
KGADQFLPVFLQDDTLAERASQIHGDLYAEFKRTAHPLPGAKELLAHLAGRGLSLWMASSAKPDEVNEFLSRLEAEDKVAGMVSKEDVASTKPAPDLVAQALDKAGCRPDEAVFVGDTIWDIEAAQKVGLRTIAVLTGGAYCGDELKQAGAIGVYQDCADLLRSGFLDSA